MNENLRDHAGGLLENWRAILPAFRFKDEQAKQVWTEYLATCTDPHKREVARFVATWSNLMDRDGDSVLGTTHKKYPFRTLTGTVNMVENTKEKAKLTGAATSESSIREAIRFMKEVSSWAELVETWEKNRDEDFLGPV